MVTFSFIGSILTWLAPGIYYLRKRNYNFVNPILIFPVFVVLTILVPFSEYLFSWSAKYSFPGLRSMSSQIMIEGGYIYIITNFYLMVSAFCYFLGIYFYKGKLIPSNLDYIKLSSIKFAKVKTKFIIYLFLIPIVTLPVVFANISALGSYFTTTLFSLINFFPAVFILYNFNVFLFCFIIALPLNFLTLSKGNIFYLFLWSLISSTIISHRVKHKKIILVFLLIIGISLSNVMISLRLEKGWEGVNSNILYSLFYREYGFDTFAADVYNRYNDQMVYSRSYILTEFLELIPSSIHELIFNEQKVRMGNLVGHEVLKEKIAIEGTGFNRYFLTAFYHDFGFLGIISISFLLGYLFNFWFYKNLSLFKKTSNRLFIARYLTFCINIHFLVNGLLYYFVATFVFMNIIISIFLYLSKNYNSSLLINNSSILDK